MLDVQLVLQPQGVPHREQWNFAILRPVMEREQMYAGFHVKRLYFSPNLIKVGMINFIKITQV
jgi:hypothetical protein